MSNFNMTAYGEGLEARMCDEAFGTITDNPYTDGTRAFFDWYKGYNHLDEVIE